MPEWNGVTLKETYREDHVNRIVRCFEPFKSGRWDDAFNPDTFHAGLVNNFEMRDSAQAEPAGWTMMHYAASQTAPSWVVTRLVNSGATRCAKDGRGRTPLDVAKETGKAGADLIAALEPRFVPFAAKDNQLDAIETNFHQLIRDVTGDLAKHLVLLPVRVLLEAKPDGSGPVTDPNRGWNFPIPGMYGGFYRIRLVLGSNNVVDHLLCESWCRVAGGSGRRDKVTAEGTELLESGFV